VRQINSSECNHSGHSDGGGSRSGKAKGGVRRAIIVDDLVIVVVVVFRINTKWIVRIAGLLLIVVRLLTVFVTLLTLFVRLLVGFTVLIFSLTLSIVVRLFLFLFFLFFFFFGAEISGAFGLICEDIVREVGNLIDVVVLVEVDVGNPVSRLDSSVVTSVGICISKHS